MAVKLIKGNEVNKYIKKDGITIINIYGTWCGPCKMFAPILEEVNENENGIDVFKIDVDENQDYAKEENISGVPTTWIYKDGKLKEKFTGFIPKQVLDQKLN